MRLFDALEMTSKPVIDDNGNMLVVSRSARTGTQIYTGASVGRPDMQWAVGYRPADEVFAADSLASYTAIPVTIEHPEKFVDADSWKDVAVGETDGAIKDGEFIRVPFTVRHARAVKTIRDGKAQISMGYSADLDWTGGVTDSGEKYDFIMRNLRMNHLAVVDSARGGPALRIGDEDSEVPPKKEAPKMNILYDGLAVDMDEKAANELVKRLTDAKDAAESALSEAKSENVKAVTDHKVALDAKDEAIKSKDVEIASLKKSLEDAAITPEKLRDAAAAYAAITAKAKAVGVTVADNDSTETIMRAVVNAKMGDAAKDWSDKDVAISFATLTAGVKANDGEFKDAYQQQMGNRNVTDFADAKTKALEARAKRNAELYGTK